MVAQLALFFEELAYGHWFETSKADKTCVELADRHYSRQKVGTSQFTRPGYNFVLRIAEGNAVWASYVSKYRKENLDAIECSIFRNESSILSSQLIWEASWASFKRFGISFKDGLITYVNPNKVSSRNPGYCFLKAGFKKMDLRSKSQNLLAFQCTMFDVMASEKLTPEFLVQEYEDIYNMLKIALKKKATLSVEKHLFMLRNVREAMNFYCLYYPSIHACELFSEYEEFPDLFEWGEGMSELLGEILYEQNFELEDLH